MQRSCRHGEDPFAQFGIQHEQAGGIILDQFQFVDDLADAGLFLDLLGDEPLEKIIGGMILFR